MTAPAVLRACLEHDAELTPIDGMWALELGNAG